MNLNNDFIKGSSYLKLFRVINPFHTVFHASAPQVVHQVVKTLLLDSYSFRGYHALCFEHSLQDKTRHTGTGIPCGSGHGEGISGLIVLIL